MSTDQRPILVTGAHRSGTTWVGKMLAASREVAYISEPLNVWHRPGVMNAPVERWYTYISDQNAHQYLPALQETLAYHYHLWDEIHATRSMKDVMRMGRDLYRFLNGKLWRQRPLIKDPFAVFSAMWFAQRLDCQVVITIRHPAAFASSLKRLSWSFDFEDLLEQPLLMEDWLGAFQVEMEQMLNDPEDVIGQSALLWRMIYQTTERFRREMPQLLIVRHEDLSLDPLQGFQQLFQSLGLGFTPQIEKTILKFSNPDNPAELDQKDVHAVRLNSQANIKNWKKRLSENDVERIYTLTREVAACYYSDQDWE